MKETKSVQRFTYRNHKGYISKGSVILVRVCILYVVNLNIMSLYTILNIS